MRVLEVCAGDGSLAARLLHAATERRLPWSIASYTLLERNETLTHTARARLSAYVNAAVVLADATNEAAYRPKGTEQPPYDVVIASGSVLCGQVGTPSDAEVALGHMASCLAPGGLLLATGFSSSYLHPQLLRESGLGVVLQGSVPAGLANGDEVPPAHGWGRFQLFVLQKGGSDSSPLFSALAGTAKEPEPASDVR